MLACQPYGGAATHIKDYGLGQGPNVVLGLCEQFGLLPGSKVYVDNLFTSLDLLDNMGDRGYGVTGTLRVNRIHGIPLTGKKEAAKEYKRGEARAVYTKDATVVVWKDNQPVYMASNCDPMEPMGECERYSAKDHAYMPYPQPYLNSLYNSFMGGVDLLDNSEKNYAIVTRLKKWYWCLYTWFLNISMVQAWRLYRANMKEKNRLEQEKDLVEDKKREEEEEEEDNKRRMEEEGEQVRGDRVAEKVREKERLKEKEKKMEEREKERKKKRFEEKKLEDISLLEFTRQVVEITVKKHGDSEVSHQRLSSSRLTGLDAVRYDHGPHLIMLTEVTGVCKHCKKRSKYRCERCEVALHADCFYDFHNE
jgi:hypothetical protein